MIFYDSRVRFIFACICLVIFVGIENPSIYAKLSHTNIQMLFWGKSIVLIGAECILLAGLFFAAQAYQYLKWILFVLIAVSTLLFDSYYLASHQSIQYQEFLLLYMSKANIGDALRMYWKEILTASIRILILFIAFALMPDFRQLGFVSCSKKKASFCAVGMLISLILFASVVCIIRQGAATNKLPAPISLYGLFLAYQYDRLKNPHIYQYLISDINSVQLVNTPPPYTHIVLIVDESIRSDYSPLKRIEAMGSGWHIYNYQKATSYANSSAVSNILLRKGAKFETIVQDFYSNPLIWDYAKKAGYATYLFDAQSGGVGHDYFDLRERTMIEHNISNTKIKSDSEIFDYLSYLNTSKKTFTLIIKKGSHFPYSDFPREFKPKQKQNYLSYEFETEMRKKYLKSTIYQTDVFIEKLLRLDAKESILLIYTSDHGQNLQDREGLTHGSTENPYEGEGEVPLIIFSSIDNLGMQKYLKDNQNNASHFNIFPTILEAMGYRADKMGYTKKNASLYSKTEKVGGFFYGIPFGYFGKTPDFQKIKSKSVLK